MKTLHPKPGVKASHLARLPVFSVLDAADREGLARQARLCLYDRGETLFERGQPATTLYCVVAGAVRVQRASPGGKVKVLHLLTAPAMVAEVPVLMGIRYPATAECAEPCTVLELPRRELQVLFHREQDLALRMLGAAMTRLHELTTSLASHGQKSSVARVAVYLLGLAHSQGDAVTLPAAKKDVASYLGLQPESFSRALASLKKQELIAVEDQVVNLLDRPALERMLADG